MNFYEMSIAMMPTHTDHPRSNGAELPYRLDLLSRLGPTPILQSIYYVTYNIRLSSYLRLTVTVITVKQPIDFRKVDSFLTILTERLHVYEDSHATATK